MTCSTAWPAAADLTVTRPSSALSSITSAARLSPSAKRMLSPGTSRRPGFAKARQRPPPAGSTRVRPTAMADGWSGLPRSARHPKSCAGSTRVSFSTRRSPGRSRSGRSRTRQSLTGSSGCDGSTRRSLAASRGTAGRKAILSAGRSKSNSLNEITDADMPSSCGRAARPGRLRPAWHRRPPACSRSCPDRSRARRA